jgi:hypothetical protein
MADPPPVTRGRRVHLHGRRLPLPWQRILLPRLHGSLPWHPPRPTPLQRLPLHLLRMHLLSPPLLRRPWYRLLHLVIICKHTLVTPVARSSFPRMGRSATTQSGAHSPLNPLPIGRLLLIPTGCGLGAVGYSQATWYKYHWEPLGVQDQAQG